MGNGCLKAVVPASQTAVVPTSPSASPAASPPAALVAPVEPGTPRAELPGVPLEDVPPELSPEQRQMLAAFFKEKLLQILAAEEKAKRRCKLFCRLSQSDGEESLKQSLFLQLLKTQFKEACNITSMSVGQVAQRLQAASYIDHNVKAAVEQLLQHADHEPYLATVTFNFLGMILYKTGPYQL